MLDEKAFTVCTSVYCHIILINNNSVVIIKAV